LPGIGVRAAGRRTGPICLGEGGSMDDSEIEDMFAALGSVRVKRMFGGKGVYHRGLMVAVQLRGEMMLKGDAVTAPDFEGAGARRWTYPGKRGGMVAMPYWTVPDSAWDDPDDMARWVRLAFEAALRAVEAKDRIARDT
jgi:DNA transformation protein and related proteins